jgi:hypothetical protein
VQGLPRGLAAEGLGQGVAGAPPLPQHQQLRPHRPQQAGNGGLAAAECALQLGGRGNAQISQGLSQRRGKGTVGGFHEYKQKDKKLLLINDLLLVKNSR